MNALRVAQNFMALSLSKGVWTAFHRTKSAPLKHTEKRFEPGPGNMYGAGFYGTLDIEPQFKDEMKRYGPYVIKYAIKPNKFLILDKDLMQSQYGTSDLSEQLKILGLNRTTSEKILSAYKKTKIVANAAQTIALLKDDFKDKISGMEFTRRQDQKTVVVYDTELISPVSYSTDDGKTWENIVSTLKYPGRKIAFPHMELNNKSSTIDLFFEFLPIEGRRKLIQDLKAGHTVEVPDYHRDAIRKFRLTDLTPEDQCNILQIKNPKHSDHSPLPLLDWLDKKPPSRVLVNYDEKEHRLEWLSHPQ